jgi:hypothetical protein
LSWYTCITIWEHSHHYWKCFLSWLHDGRH